MMALAAVVAPVCLAAQRSAADSAVEACMVADTSTRWIRVGRAWAAGQGERGTDDSLRARLLALGARDQAPRSGPAIGDSLGSPEYLRRLAAEDSADAAELMEIVRRHGWPTRRLVGSEAASAAFLVAQHNQQVQHQALRLMQALPPGEVSPTDLAMLEDRVRVGDGLPQRYGSQLKLSEDGRTMRFDPIEDLAGLEERRARVGLPPLTVYICMMRGMYGREIIPPREMDGAGRMQP